jgi:2-amino-4-hydroxy-6-hydroxymethyldihydropteridine diphosphokinase
MHWIPAYVGLGANLDDPREQVERALARLAQLRDTKLIARSRLYRTRPMGPQDQPDFVNAAAGLLTRLEVRELLSQMQGIEKALGRQPPPVHWGPRAIDLDLLLYDALVLSEPGLVLPHPGVHQRSFVLYPLSDFAPDLDIPGHGRVAHLKRRVAPDDLEELP